MSSTTLTVREDMPVKFGTDFNAVDPCNLEFTRRFCQLVESTDQTKFQVEAVSSGSSQAPIQGDWTVTAGWVANANGTITHTVGVTTATLVAFLTNANVYRLTMIVTGRTAGVFTVGAALSSVNYSAVRTEVFVFETTSTTVTVTPTTDFDGTIQFTFEDIDDFNFDTTNLIINGTFDSDTSWGKGTGWTIAAGIASKAAGVEASIGQSVRTPTQTGATNQDMFTNKLYKVTWTVSGRTAGSIFLTGGNANNTLNHGIERNTNATFTDYIVIREQAEFVDTDIAFQATSSFDGDIDNIQAVELAMTQYRIEDCDGITRSVLPQSMIDRVTDTIENICLDWDGWPDLVTNGDFSSILLSGTDTANTAFKLRDAGATFTTDGLEVSMLVINTSTNASSRIAAIDSDIQLSLDQDIFTATPENYEIYNWKEGNSGLTLILIAAGVASFQGGGSPQLFQAVDVLAGSKYLLTYTILNYVAGSFRPELGSAIGTLRNANGTFSEVLTFSGTPNLALESLSSGNFDIDNISLAVDLEDGCYRICVDTWNGSSFVEQTCSECYCLADDHPCTILFTFTNNEDLGPFQYDYSFTQQQRLSAELINPNYPLEVENNKDRLGVITTILGLQEKIPILHIDDAPQYVHDWASVMFIHDTWNIDAVKYVIEAGEDYDPLWRSQRGVLKLSKARIEVKKGLQTNINYNT